MMKEMKGGEGRGKVNVIGGGRGKKGGCGKVEYGLEMGGGGKGMEGRVGLE